MRRVGRFADKFTTYLSNLGAVMGCSGIIIMTMMITVGVMLRYVFNRPILFVEEISAGLLVVLVYMGAAYTERVRGHINVEVVVRRLPQRVRDRLEVVTSLIALVVVGIYFRFVLELFIDTLVTHRTKSTIYEFPMWPAQLIMCVGLIFFGLAITAHTVKKFRDFQKGPKKGAGGDASATPDE